MTSQPYALVTGQADAFYQMCMVLPGIIEKVVDGLEGVAVPHDTVVEELRGMAAGWEMGQGDLAVAMAVYMLGFGSYAGFYPAYQFMPNPLLVNGCFPFNVLRTLSNRLDQETGAIIIVQQLVLHFYKSFPRARASLMIGSFVAA